MSVLWLRPLSLLSHVLWRIRMLIGIPYQAKIIEHEYIETASITTMSPKPQYTPEVMDTIANTDPVNDPTTANITEVNHHADAISLVDIANAEAPASFEERIANLSGVITPNSTAFDSQTSSTTTSNYSESERTDTLFAKPQYTPNMDTEIDTSSHSEFNNKEMSNWTFILIALFIFGISIGSFFIN